MYHPNHPDGSYRMANRVQVLDPPSAIALTSTGPRPPRSPSPMTGQPRRTPPGAHRVPPLAPDHLGNSLDHLAVLAARQAGPVG
jgi:hypothetical protein